MASQTFTGMPTPSNLLSAYASISTSYMLFQTMFSQLIPKPLRHYILNTIRFYWKPKTKKLTLIFDEKNGISVNHMFDVAETYLCTKIASESPNCLKITKSVKEPNINIKFAQDEVVLDRFEDIELSWAYVREEKRRRFGNNNIEEDEGNENGSSTIEKRSIELSFDKKHKEKVVNMFLPFIINRAEEIKNERRVVKLHSLEYCYRDGPVYWDSVNLDHPTTFDKLAMDPKLKKAIIEDLDRFVERKEFYKKVGKAWKRGYLLYGPPGTGKSSLIAAMANYLKFDVYDLQLTNVGGDSCLRKLLMKTANRSIMVIEDIDCSVELPDRKGLPVDNLKPPRGPQFSLAGLLNFIDGLWSCCGDSRIIIFTTNNKERLDPALLRPGRMDMHIHMSYITIDGVKTLAANYLNIHDNHNGFREIEELITSANVTPAEVAEELMRTNDTEVALDGVVNLLKRKKTEQEEKKPKRMDEEENKEGIEDGDEIHEAKKAKTREDISLHCCSGTNDNDTSPDSSP